MGVPTFAVEVAFDADPSATYRDSVLGDRPTVYWRLNEHPAGTGAAVDASGNGFNGTYVGSPNSGIAGALPGDPDRAIAFNGSSQYVTSTLSATTAQLATFSIEGWVKKTGAPGAAVVVAGISGSAQLDIAATTGKATVNYFDGAAFQTATSAASVCDGIFHHLVGSYDGTTLVIYVDGVISAVITPTATPVGNANGLGAAAFADGTSKLSGTLDEIAFYRNVALTASQVAAHYRARKVNVTPTWVDITDRVQTINTRRGRNYELDQNQAGTADIYLDNVDRALDPANASSAFYPNVIPLRRLRVKAVLPENLVSNGSFESNTTGWTGFNGGSVIRVQANERTPKFGTFSGRVHSTGVDSGIQFGVTTTAATTYAYSTWLYSATGGTYYVQLSDGIDQPLNGPFTFVPAGIWTRISGTGTTDTHTARAVNILSRNAFVEDFWVDGVQLEHGSTVSDWTTPTSGAVATAQTFYLFTGYVERWPQTSEGPAYASVTVTAVDGFAALQNAVITGTIPSAASGTQVTTALNAASWAQSARTIDAGVSTLATSTFAAGDDQTALAFITSAADSELGNFYISADGRAVFEDRLRRQTAPHTTSTATFGDDATNPNELEYVELQPTVDPTRIINDWRVIASGSANTQVVVDDDSIRTYFRRTQTRSTLLATDADALAQAQFLLGNTKQPSTHFEPLSFEPLASDALWTQALTREISDRITVVRRPPGSGSISQDCFIEAIAWSIDRVRETARITWQLSPVVGQPVFTLDDATLGKLDNANTLAY